jgi:hypothetical protein
LQQAGARRHQVACGGWRRRERSSWRQHQRGCRRRCGRALQQAAVRAGAWQGVLLLLLVAAAVV